MLTQIKLFTSNLNSKYLAKTFKHFSTNNKREASTWPLNWELQSVWSENLVNNEVVHKFKESIESLSDGKWKINTKFGVNKDLAFDNVKNKKTQMVVGHSTYWSGMNSASAFFASIPFGMSHSEFRSWIAFGGGRKFWEQLYEPHNLYPFLAGDTGMQMGGWFPKKINTVKDFKGLKMRIEGLGGPVVERLGTKLVDAPASKLLSMLESGQLDCCEFATPVMDEAAGLHKTTTKLILHYPGWHQPSAVFEFLLNKDLHKTLSNEQVAMIDAASQVASLHFTLHLQAENEVVIEKMVKQGVELHQFPDDLLKELKKISEEVLEETMKGDKFSNEVKESYLKFLERMSLWGPMSGSALWKWRNK